MLNMSSDLDVASLYRRLLQDSFPQGNELKPDLRFPPPLYSFLDLIFYMPLSWRKLFLDACRIQQPIFLNQSLLTTANNLGLSSVIIAYPFKKSKRSKAEAINLESICELFSNFYDSPPLCTLISFFLRAESTVYKQQFLDQMEETKNKEISASMQPLNAQQLQYQCLFTDSLFVGVHREISTVPHRTIRLWKARLSNFITMTSHEQIPPLLPYYNKNKNVSYDTQTRLFIAKMGISPDYQPKTFTSFSVLSHYMETGEQVRGAMEMRVSWKFGDLKPRVYYCLGGASLWDGLYIKPIANYLVKAFPSTNPDTRFDIQRIGSLERDELLITYDYTSFTTSLSELRYFLWHLGTALCGCTIPVLDVFTGIEYIDVGEYILAYNESVNQYQEFDIGRFVDQVRFAGEHILTQTRSGSLGTQGNIVFSTLNHGISLAGFTDTPDYDSCVGDDALFKTLAPYYATACMIVNKLGAIEASKFSVMSRPSMETYRQQQIEAFKYLKRPISVNTEGKIFQGFLDFFPSLADIVYEGGDGIHTTSSLDTFELVRAFCNQWGRYLNLCYQNPYFSSLGIPDELEPILVFIQACYGIIGIPTYGAVPGQCFLNWRDESGREIRFFIPPCDTLECFQVPWPDVLYARFHDNWIQTPLKVGKGSLLPPRSLIPGDSFSAESVPLLDHLVDFGYLSREMEILFVRFDDAFLERFKIEISGLSDDSILYTYTVISPPSWYDSYVDLAYPGFYSRDSQEVLEEISTIFGSSIS